MAELKWVAVLALMILNVNAMVMPNDTCITVPQDATCVSYTLPAATSTSQVNALCGMHGMPGCTIQTICTHKEYSANPLCNIFATYKEICIDMPGMSNCSIYKSMCSVPGSQVAQCNMTVIPLPSTMQTSNLIKGICSEMYMDGCDLCDHSCDLLTVYSNLCLAMPDMTQCQAWKTMCTSIPNFPLCSTKSNNNPIPIMRMYFHTGELDYILFKEWVPTSTGYYVGSLFIVLATGILFEFLKLIRSRLELKWKLMRKPINAIEDLEPDAIRIFDFSAPKINFGVDLLRSILHFLEYTFGLLLMLVAMTFNVGLFFAVCLGALIGNFMFGRYMQYEAKASCCS